MANNVHGRGVPVAAAGFSRGPAGVRHGPRPSNRGTACLPHRKSQSPPSAFRALSLPVAGLHVDLVRAPEQLAAVARRSPKDMALSLGLIDGRNVWRADLSAILDRIRPVIAGWPVERVEVAPSCPLLHVPIDPELEDALDTDVKSWLAFAAQKIDELVVLSRALAEGQDAVAKELHAASEAAAARSRSLKVHDPLVQGRLKDVTEDMRKRRGPYRARRAAQRLRLALPAFPTTTIGSFPQTAEVRKARFAHARGKLSFADYESFLRRETEAAIRMQEEIGLDVLVHGEFERNDMVQYFGEQIALAIRDEVADLEAAGAVMIQIDEAALREGLPLRKADRQHYLDWAVGAFRLASTGVTDATQIHTHMCYSEFNDIVDAIAAMDADVISIETSRSRMELLDAFRTFKYPNAIGPGVYDIHSPRVPDIGEISDLLLMARQRVGEEQLWVNPDCGLKTRGWNEVRPALANMVAAARRLRQAAEAA